MSSSLTERKDCLFFMQVTLKLFQSPIWVTDFKFSKSNGDSECYCVHGYRNQCLTDTHALGNPHWDLSQCPGQVPTARYLSAVPLGWTRATQSKTKNLVHISLPSTPYFCSTVNSCHHLSLVQCTPDPEQIPQNPALYSRELIQQLEMI